MMKILPNVSLSATLGAVTLLLAVCVHTGCDGSSENGAVTAASPSSAAAEESMSALLPDESPQRVETESETDAPSTAGAAEPMAAQAEGRRAVTSGDSAQSASPERRESAGDATTEPSMRVMPAGPSEAGPMTTGRTAASIEEASADMAAAAVEAVARGGDRGDPNVVPVGIQIEPALLDFGDIPTGDAGIGKVRLTNVGDAPRVLLDCRTSCGCTTTNCERNRVLEPGEFVEIEVKLDGGQRPQLLTKTVTFLFSEHAPLRLTVRGNAVAYVSVEPDVLDAVRNPDGRVVIKSSDGQPFRIRSMFPPIIEDLPADAKVEHELYFSYDQLREEGFRQRRILVRVDHPKADRVTISLAPNVVAPARAADGRPTTTGAVARNAALARLDGLLSSGQEDAAIEMLNADGFGIDFIDNDQQTPLIKAARWGKTRLLEALLDAGADIGAADRLGRTALVYACQSKNLEAVRVMLAAGADISRPDDLGNTPIGWAAGFGTVEIVRELIDRGAEPDVRGGALGFTPIIWASAFGDASVVELLLDNGADVQTMDSLEGMNSLMHAIRTNRHDIVRLLLERGARLEDRNKEGSTAFLVAARNAGADAEMIRLLIEAGADVSVKDNRGRNAIELAAARTDFRGEEVAAAVRAAMRGTSSQR